MVGEGDTRLVGTIEVFCPESILGLFEMEGFSTVGSSLPQNTKVLGETSEWAGHPARVSGT